MFRPASLLLTLALALAAPASAEPRGDAEAAFERLKTLLGQWQGTFDNGRTHQVSYRTTAGGTVLMETWSLGPGRESVTLYHLDGERLLATHYCPQGNQPRLQWIGDDADGRMQFRFVDGTHLEVPGKSHQHAFWLRLDGADRYTRSETYVENGSTPGERTEAQSDPPVTYTRIAPPGT